MIVLKNVLLLFIVIFDLIIRGKISYLFKSLRRDGFRPRINLKNSPTTDELFKDAIVVQNIMEKIRLRTPVRFFSLDLSPSCNLEKKSETCGNVGKCQVFGNESDLSSTLFGFDMETDEMIPEEEGNCESKKTKVDMLKNPPSNTEYKGGSIWNMIYEEIDKLNMPLLLNLTSGVQSNIAVHASERYKKVGDKFEYNIKNFIDKFLIYEERGSNLLFTFYYLVQSMCVLGEKFDEFMNQNLDDNPENEILKSEIRALFDSESYYSCREEYMNNRFFSESDLPKLSKFFETFISTLGCVECEKCILHGTIKGNTLYLATKALARKNNFQIDPLTFVTYINGLYVFSSSIMIIDIFAERIRHYLSFLICTLIFSVLSYKTIKSYRRMNKIKTEKND
ncbi:hypothetical protein FG379_000482 [Cryptosporidium bovis]|uniref:uncharacterized protein n=1 Tax=Cryptosporidium bovis TaxID=310047 RepID=UPI003519E326|nr:hypothetical protein FG379_000482 [Cryptosporidium bovis]